VERWGADGTACAAAAEVDEEKEGVYPEGAVGRALTLVVVVVEPWLCSGSTDELTARASSVDSRSSTITGRELDARDTGESGGAEGQEVAAVDGTEEEEPVREGALGDVERGPGSTAPAA
jgi:hypothetical protein